MIDHEQWQGKPAVKNFRDIDASLGRGNQGRVKPPEQWTFDDLIDYVQTPDVSEVTHDYYLSLPKTAKAAKDAGLDPRVNQGSLKTGDPFVLFGACRDGVRDDAHLLGRSALTLDYDQTDSRALMRAIALERFAPPFAFVWHTTRSHDVNLLRETNQPKLRLIVPLSRDVTANEFEALTDALDAWINLTVHATLDPASRKPAQMMYCPVHNQGAQYLHGWNEGDGYLDPDWMLQHAPVKLDKPARLKQSERADAGALIGAEPRLAGYGYEEIQDLLDDINPDLPYDEWMKVLAGVHHQMRGSDEGIDLLDEWSQDGDKYVSRDDVAKHYQSFSSSQSRRLVTLKSVIKLANDSVKAENKAALLKLLDDFDNCGDVDQLEELEAQARRMNLTDELTIERVIKTIQTRQQILVGAKVRTDKLRKQLTFKPPPPAVVQQGNGTYEYTEFGNMERMADAHTGELSFVPSVDMWMRWRDLTWQIVPEDYVRRLAQETVNRMGREAENMNPQQAAAHYDWCRKSQTAHMVNSMVALFRSSKRTGVLVDASELDADMNLLGCPNGTLHLDTGKFREADREDYITRITSVPYHEDAQCPTFERVVSDAFAGDAEMIEWFHRLLGYSIIGKPSEQFLVIPYGPGSNGKSTILNAVREVLGSHARVTPHTTFLGDDRSTSAGAPNEALLSLKGSRFVYMSEPESGSQLRTGLIKAVTGGDAVRARAPHAKQSVEFFPTWVIFMATNHKPIVKDDDEGIWRRMKLVPFMQRFEKDVTLADRLKAEYPGILRWLVSGAIAYQRDGLGADPRAVRDAHGAYRQDMDVLHEWLEDCCVRDPDSFTSKQDLWASWERYAERNRTLMLVPSLNALSRRLTDRGFTPSRNSKARGFDGIRVRGPDETVRNAKTEGFE